MNDPIDGGGLLAQELEGGGAAREWSSPRKRSIPLRKADRRDCKKVFRKLWLSTRPGRKKENLREEIQLEPSGEMPPPGTTQCRCGCKWRFCPQV